MKNPSPLHSLLPFSTFQRVHNIFQPAGYCPLPHSFLFFFNGIGESFGFQGATKSCYTIPNPLDWAGIYGTFGALPNTAMG
jgi:hypothetical protein